MQGNQKNSFKSAVKIENNILRSSLNERTVLTKIPASFSHKKVILVGKDNLRSVKNGVYIYIT